MSTRCRLNIPTRASSSVFKPSMPAKKCEPDLRSLPDRARMALVLRYYADMSYEEIADTLGVRRAFVGVLLLRARHQLRDALAEGDPKFQRASAGGG